MAFINDPQASLAKQGDASQVEFVAQARLVHGSQQPRAEGSMHFDGAADDAPCQIVIRLHWNSPCLGASVVKFLQAEVKDS